MNHRQQTQSKALKHNDEESTDYQTMELPNQQCGSLAEHQQQQQQDGIFHASADDSLSKESHTRSLLKGLTWRAVATGTTITISWLVIGDVTVAFQIGFFEVFAKIAIYYLHERIWAKIPV